MAVSASSASYWFSPLGSRRRRRRCDCGRGPRGPLLLLLPLLLPWPAAGSDSALVTTPRRGAAARGGGRLCADRVRGGALSPSSVDWSSSAPEDAELLLESLSSASEWPLVLKRSVERGTGAADAPPMGRWRRRRRLRRRR
ncbi:hypothetical protein ATCC90586_010977 [Pythium insidiosum]|nr:hypothetical protein ATCC90586_010977 [Pythium insidiosum]